MKRKYRIIKVEDHPHGYKYNVQEWHSIDGVNFYYSGYGRFCHTREEAAAYIAARKKEDF